MTTMITSLYSIIHTPCPKNDRVLACYNSDINDIDNIWQKYYGNQMLLYFPTWPD